MNIKYFYNSKDSSPTKKFRIDDYRDGCLINISDINSSELEEFCDRFNLDIGIVQDATDKNESPRIETSDNTVYVFLRIAKNVDSKVDTFPVLIVITKKTMVVVDNFNTNLVQGFFEKETDTYTNQHTTLTLRFVGDANRRFKSNLNSSIRKILAVRGSLNKEHISNKNFIYFIDIEEDLNDFLVALNPLKKMFDKLLNGKILKLYEEDQELINDTMLEIDELIEISRSNLRTIVNIREAYSTIMANNLNKVFKLMTSITILMSIFTIVTGIYSMNVKLPDANDPNAFWLILSVTISLIAMVGLWFKKNKWF